MVYNTNRKVNWKYVVQTYGGDIWDYSHLTENVVNIEAMAHALSQKCRWNGHTIVFFSVAQHSCNVFDQVLKDTGDINAAGQGLIHDSPEAYYIDVPRPLKAYLNGYAEIIKNAEAYLFDELGFPTTLLPSVETVDNRMLSTEYVQLVDIYDELRLPPMLEFAKKYPPYSKKGDADSWDLSTSWSPRKAEDEFLKRWETVVKRRETTDKN